MESNTQSQIDKDEKGDKMKKNSQAVIEELLASAKGPVKETVQVIPLSEIGSYPLRPLQVRDDAEVVSIVESGRDKRDGAFCPFGVLRKYPAHLRFA